MKIQDKFLDVDRTYKSHQSKIEDMVGTNIQEVLDTTHDCNKEIRRLEETVADKVIVEDKLHQISNKHAQRIARITDNSLAQYKASVREMSSKYNTHFQTMSQHRQEIYEIISSFRSHQEAQQVKLDKMMEFQTKEMNE